MKSQPTFDDVKQMLVDELSESIDPKIAKEIFGMDDSERIRGDKEMQDKIKNILD